MTTFKIEDMFQPGTFGIFDATTGEKVAHQHTLDMFANCNADFASAIENAHTMTEAEFDKRCQNGRLHAHVLRDNFELPVREYIFGKAPKPKLEKLLEKYIYLYNHSIECNVYRLNAVFKNFCDGIFVNLIIINQ